jgi:1,4-alpha-glucan branching enzyme
VAAFDAELFGHWWFEGPRFLRDVILTLAADAEIGRMTTAAALAAARPDKVMRLAEGSWGKMGDHSVWLNDNTRWMWEVEHRAERDLVKAIASLNWRGDASVAESLGWAARELMLLQASDWPFIVENKSALDYGIKRFCGHATRFDRALEIAASKTRTPLQDSQLAEIRAHDSVFREIDLAWWE